jgi:hypothetical protein
VLAQEPRVEVSLLAVGAGENEELLDRRELLVPEQRASQMQPDVVPPGDDQGRNLDGGYVWKIGTIATVPSDQVVDQIGPTVQRYLTRS